jgi:prefoldin alpha subunit
MNEEILQKAMMLQQQSKEAEQQLGFVNEQIGELNKFENSLDVLDKNKDKEILAPLGKGVFVRSEIKDENLFVEVGAGIVVRKTASETKKVIEEQLKRFMEARIQIVGQLESFRGELGRMIDEIEKMKAKN